MLTDPLPRARPRQAEYRRSDELLVLPLPDPAPLRQSTQALFAALKAEATADVRSASRLILEQLADFYRVPAPEVRVLGVRPHRIEEGTCTYQLYGDYATDSHRIRIWMRTAVREKVSAPKAFLSTLLHEAAHHLDCTGLELPQTFHTRGFFQRVDELYHHALGTPPEERKQLVWVKSGSGWRIDWMRTRASTRR